MHYKEVGKVHKWKEFKVNKSKRKVMKTCKVGIGGI